MHKQRENYGENNGGAQHDAHQGGLAGHHHYHHAFDDDRPRKRLCCRPACGQLAVSTLRYSHAERRVLLGPLSEESDPHSWDLCERHASRVTPPQGWTLQRDSQADNMMALYDSVNMEGGQADAPGAAHGAVLGGAFGSARGGVNRSVAGADQGAVATPTPCGTAPRPSTPVSRAVEDIQETIVRLDRRGTAGSPSGSSIAASAGSAFTAGTGSGFTSSTRALSEFSRHRTPAPTEPEDEDAELEQWEEDLMSPLLEAAKERAQDRKFWRGRGEENSRPGRHRRIETSTGSEDEALPESDVRHPSLRNLAGTRRFRLHALPDPEDD